LKPGITTTGTEPRSPRFHFVGGKGGVGKTTCAAALAVSAAPRHRVLVASTDPAPSLGDALAVSLASAPRRVPLRRGRLWAVEVDATLALRRWLNPRRGSLEKIAVDGTWLDHEDVARLLALSLPGVDELAALLEIDRFARTGRYDLIIIDTAPTGHALRMLTMPETLYGIAVVFDRMREKQRVVEEALRGAWRPTAGDALIDELAATSRTLSATLRDPDRTRISWVSLPEPMAVAESIDAIAALRRSGIQVTSVIANRLTPPPLSACGRCAARRVFERRALARLPPVDDLVGVSDRDPEPVGASALRSLAAELEVRLPPRRKPTTRRVWKAALSAPREDPSNLVRSGTRLVLFGGKGGVGKTTCAAAHALSAAFSRPRDRVLLVSTDPAHSLGDVFVASVSDLPRRVAGGPPNLAVREIDPASILARIQQRYAEAIDSMFDRVRGSPSLDAVHDRAVMRGLIELAPPGLDELISVLEITDAISVDPPAWDLVVMDTAPTGHALRLLEMPGLMQEWAKALMAILLKYQGAVRLGELGETLVNLSRGVGRLRALLADRNRAAFIVVTRAASLPRRETARLAARLATLRIHVPAVVINAVGRGECRRCAKASAAERREIAVICRALGRTGRRIVVTGAELPPPAGAAALRRWGRTSWYRAPGYHQRA
jgi:arsenite-transporting ATPase